MRRAYSDPEYRAAAELLKRSPQLCVWCKVRPGTEPDHVPSLAEHAHVRGSGCCSLVPACASCNRGRGARLANRRRRARPTASRTW